MPKNTFLNLKSSKREQFLKAAFREFAQRDYGGASVSRIVARLGIAKGSVYQYFRDKHDLYLYLLDAASSRKLEFIRERTDAAAGSGGFEELHRALILAGATFDFQNPHYALLILNAMRERHGPGLKGMADDLRSRSTAFVHDYVRQGAERGTIRPDVDVLLIVTFVNAASLAVARYMEEKYGFSLIEKLEHPRRPLPFSEEQLRTAVDALVAVVWRGIAARP